MKRIFYFGMVLLALVTISACSSDEILNEENSVAQTALTSKQAELAALQVGNNLMNSFKENVSRSGSDQQIIYPDYYGGCYLDENHNLVVLVTGDANVYKQDVMTRANSSDFVLKSCEYSYNELNDVMNELNQFFLNDANGNIVDALQWHSFALSDKDNCIYVRLGDFTDANIARFKQMVLDSPILDFEKSGGIPVFDAAPQPGGALGYSSGREDASMGYRAKYNGEEGFVTAGHFLSVVGEYVYCGNTQVGYCEQTQLDGIDAAWCVSFTNYYPTRITPMGVNLSATVGLVLFGSTATMEGITSGISYGNVTSTSTTARFNAVINGVTRSYQLTDCVETDYSASGGDSGGVVYDLYNYVLGIHSGHNSFNSYFTKAENINSTFNLSMY